MRVVYTCLFTFTYHGALQSPPSNMHYLELRAAFFTGITTQFLQSSAILLLCDDLILKKNNFLDDCLFWHNIFAYIFITKEILWKLQKMYLTLQLEKLMDHQLGFNFTLKKTRNDITFLNTSLTYIYSVYGVKVIFVSFRPENCNFSTLSSLVQI